MDDYYVASWDGGSLVERESYCYPQELLGLMRKEKVPLLKTERMGRRKASWGKAENFYDAPETCREEQSGSKRRENGNISLT